MGRRVVGLCKEVTEQAELELRRLEGSDIAIKLKAIIALESQSMHVIADVLGTTRQSIRLWIDRFIKKGVEGLKALPRAPRSSKLTPEQKRAVFSWVEGSCDCKGNPIHWTLEKLRHEIIEVYQTRLGINTLWVMVKKQGFSFKTPRPRHYKQDPEQIGVFKKNS